MSKKKDVRSCPNCGSKNLQTEGYSRKGRQLYVCIECDFEFEVRKGNAPHHPHGNVRKTDDDCNAYR